MRPFHRDVISQLRKSMKNLKTSLSFIGLLVTTLIWGSSFLVTKDTLLSVNPAALLAYRSAIAAGIFAGICGVRREKLWRRWQCGSALGLLLWLQLIFQMMGLQWTSTANSAFITGLFIVFVPVFGPLFFGKKPTFMQMIAILIACLGLWFLTGGLKTLNSGDLLTFVTAITGGLYVLLIDKFMKDGQSMLTLNFQQFLITSLLSFLAMILLHLPTSIGGLPTLIAIGYAAIFVSALAYGLQFLCQKNLRPFTASLLLCTEPVFAALFAWTIGKEPFLPSKAIGIACIFISTLISEM